MFDSLLVLIYTVNYTTTTNKNHFQHIVGKVCQKYLITTCIKLLQSNTPDAKNICFLMINSDITYCLLTLTEPSGFGMYSKVQSPVPPSHFVAVVQGELSIDPSKMFSQT